MKRGTLLLVLLAAVVSPCAASRTLEDQVGRTVVVPDHPHRLICLTPSVTDAVYALGAGNDVIAISDYTKYPPDARRKPSIGTPLNPSLETIVTLHPDLVIGSADLAPTNLKSFERVGIPVFLVKANGIAGIYSSVLALGKALDREPAGERLVAQLTSRVDAVEARVRGKERVRVFLVSYPEPVVTIGKGAFITDLIWAAGGDSITKDMPHEFPKISFETVVALAPESILLVSAPGMSVGNLEQRPGWRDLPAIRQHHVYYIDDRVNLASPIAFDALEDLAKQFHP